MNYKYFLPFGIFAVVAVVFFIGLGLNPSKIPSAKIGKPAPEFSAAALYDRTPDLTTQSLKGGGFKLVNIFASWCVPCLEEHPILMALKQRGVAIHGLNYKDTKLNAQNFLFRLGNPYELIGQDLDGRIAIEWGNSGVPETFVLNDAGEIIFQHIGALSREVVIQDILPLIEGGNDN